MIREIQKGDPITADWLNTIVRSIRSMRLQSGPGIRLTRTPVGTTIDTTATAPVQRQHIAATAGYPYGEQYNFGIKINGARVTVYKSIAYRAGVALEVPTDSVTIVDSGDWVALQYDPSSGATSFVLWGAAKKDAHGDIPSDPADGGIIVRALHKFELTESGEEEDETKTAKLVFSTMFDGQLAMMGY